MVWPFLPLFFFASNERSSFLSNNGLYCAEGESRAAQAALAMKKAAPTGPLFNLSFAQHGVGCAALDFVVSETDDCTPGVTVGYKSAEDREHFLQAEQLALKSFAQQYSLDEQTVALMVACTCAPSSPKLLAAGKNCSALDQITGCWVHSDPYPFGSHPNSLIKNRQLMCDEGPFVRAVRSLSVIKSSPQLAMHFHDNIATTTSGKIGSCCASLNFTQQYPPPDHCYPAMRIWTRSAIGSDAGVKESVWLEGNLTNHYKGGPDDGFVAFAAQHGIDDVDILNNNLGCNCLSTSTVGHQMASECWSGKPSDLPHSPVRDVWPAKAIS